MSAMTDCVAVPPAPTFGDRFNSPELAVSAEFDRAILRKEFRGAAATNRLCIECSMTPSELELLVTREMPFGKHKGVVIADLPGNYLNWFARKGFPKGEIGRLLCLMQEMDHNGLRSLLDPLRKRRA